MKKKVVMALLVLTMVGSLVACGKESVDSGSQESVEDVVTETKEKEPKVEKEESKKEEVNIWGAYYKTVMETGEGKAVSYSIQFPSLVPAGSYKIAYQMDPTLALVGYGGPDYRADSLETVLPACMEKIIFFMDDYRDFHYSDFSFNIDSTELVTINERPMCKYTGTHSFKVDDDSYEIPFVAYSVDLQTGSEAYTYLMVLDESVLHPERPAVENGVIEDYAYRMAQSIHVIEN